MGTYHSKATFDVLDMAVVSCVLDLRSKEIGLVQTNLMAQINSSHQKFMRNMLHTSYWMSRMAMPWGSFI